jgi:hypothetical protein
MTLRFLREYRANTTCSSNYCKGEPADSYKTCDKHRDYAREQFRQWRVLRKKQGLCIACDRRGYRGECRCLLHKGVNQAKCRAWMKKNKDWCAFRSAFERMWLKQEGICRYCRRGPAIPGRIACGGCSKRHAVFGAKYRAAQR